MVLGGQRALFVPFLPRVPGAPALVVEQACPICRSLRVNRLQRSTSSVRLVVQIAPGFRRVAGSSIGGGGGCDASSSQVGRSVRETSREQKSKAACDLTLSSRECPPASFACIQPPPISQAERPLCGCASELVHFCSGSIAGSRAPPKAATASPTSVEADSAGIRSPESSGRASCRLGRLSPSPRSCDSRHSIHDW